MTAKYVDRVANGVTVNDRTTIFLKNEEQERQRGLIGF